MSLRVELAPKLKESLLAGASTDGQRKRERHSLIKFHAGPECRDWHISQLEGKALGKESKTLVEVKFSSKTGPGPGLEGVEHANKEHDCLLLWNEQKSCYVLHRLDSTITVSETLTDRAMLDDAAPPSIKSRERLPTASGLSASTVKVGQSRNISLSRTTGDPTLHARPQANSESDDIVSEGSESDEPNEGLRGSNVQSKDEDLDAEDDGGDIDEFAAELDASLVKAPSP